MTVVENDQKASFSIAITPITPLYHRQAGLIRTLYCGVLSKEVSSTILNVPYIVSGMTRSPGPLGEHSTHWTNEPV